MIQVDSNSYKRKSVNAEDGQKHHSIPKSKPTVIPEPIKTSHLKIFKIESLALLVPISLTDSSSEDLMHGSLPPGQSHEPIWNSAEDNRRKEACPSVCFLRAVKGVVWCGVVWSGFHRGERESPEVGLLASDSRLKNNKKRQGWLRLYEKATERERSSIIVLKRLLFHLSFFFFLCAVRFPVFYGLEAIP